MAESLDDLVDFLLEEIALRGEKGLGLAELIASIIKFYNPTGGHSQGRLAEEETPVPEARVGRSPDPNFIHHVWKWLGRRADVFIGQDGQFNETTLKEIDERNPGYLSTAFEHASQLLKAYDNPQDLDHIVTTARADEPPSTDKAGFEGPRIYVTEERMSLAICGHLPDPSKVFPSEWQLLSHIAATRRIGILQGELGRATGQDKRSVPKRTDMLQEKGYIVKKTVYVKGNKTSRLFLRRFVVGEPKGNPTSHQQNAWHAERLTIKYQALQFFNILKSHPLISQEDMADALSMSDPGKGKVLSLLIRHFSRAGCVKRVKTACGPAATEDDLQICIQYLQEPTDEDWTSAIDDGIDFDMTADELAKPYQHLGADDGDGDSEEAVIGVSNLNADLATDSHRVLPVWSPDRTLANTVLQAVEEAALEGIKQAGLRKRIMGPFVRRVLESLLLKLSYKSLESQPPGLKHLSVIRAKEATDPMQQFCYRSFDAYAQKVHRGEATWDDVDGSGSVLQQFTAPVATNPADPSFKKDAIGFPANTSPMGQYKSGRTSQLELIRLAKIQDMRLAIGDPVSELTHKHFEELTDAPTATSVMAVVQPRGRPMNVITGAVSGDSEDIRKRKKQVHKNPARFVARGRPRKFPRGTEKFWQDMTKIATRLVEADLTQETGVEITSKASLGMEVFRQRPQGFDETLLRAIEAGLPVPSIPQGINKEWIQDTQAILDLSEDGLYFTPTGVKYQSKGQTSKFMVVKSTRLSELNFSVRPKVWSWHFLTSSAAHSFRYRSTYPALGKLSEEPSVSRRPSYVPKQKPVHRLPGPPRGIFVEEVQTEELARRSNIQVVDSNEQVATIATNIVPSDTETDPDVSQYVVSNGQRSPRRSPSVTGIAVKAAAFESCHREDSSNHDDTNAVSLSPIVRSTRRRKPTQKAVENMLNDETRNAAFPSVGNNTNFEEPTGNQSPTHFASQSRTSQAREEYLVEPTGRLIQLLVAEQEPMPASAAEATISSNTDMQETFIEPEQENGELGPPINSPGALYITGFPVTSVQDSAPAIKPGQVNQPIQQADNAALDTHLHSRSPSAASSSYPPVTPVQRDLSDDSDEVRPTKRVKYNTPRVKVPQSQTSKMCRAISIELIKLCSGLAPNDSWTFRRAMVTRWIESGIASDPPDARMIRRNLKLLASGAKVKQITFAFRAQNGAMVTKTIIALRKFEGSSPEVLDLQRKMTEAFPEDYVPPELAAEFDRVPAAVRATRQDSEAAWAGEESDGLEDLHLPPTPKGPRHSKAVPDANPPAAANPSDASSVFLTLKVSRLASLNLPAGSTVQHNFPQTTTLTNPGSVSALPQTHHTHHAHRMGLRRQRKSRFDAETHNIIWLNDDQARFPKSLDDIPNMDLSRDQAALSSQGNVDFARFLAEVDCVSSWEIKSKDQLSARLPEYTFINHTGSQDKLQHLEPRPQNGFASVVLFDEEGDMREEEIQNEGSWQPFVEALHPLTEPVADAEPPIRQKRKYTKRKKIIANDDDDADFEDGTPNGKANVPAKKRRRIGSRKTSERTSRASRDPRGTAMDNRKGQKFRRPIQVVRYMPEELQYRIVVSVIVIRTLAGGIEKYIDWSLVNPLFPEQQEEYLQVAWKSLLNRYRADVNGLTESLQDKYLDALAAGRVPSIDFEDLQSSDWEGIIDWAMLNLERFQISKVDELPNSREDFWQHNDYTVTAPPSLRSTLNFAILTTQNRREELMGALIFGSPVIAKSNLDCSLQSRLEGPPEEWDLIRARSWVLSLLLTPEATYSPQKAHKTLLKLASTPKLCEKLIDRALASLQRNRWIARIHEGGKLPASRKSMEVGGVRVWQVSARYYEQLVFRRQISGAMLRTAAQYKIEVLDKAFSQGATVKISPDFMSDAGEIIAIVNLFQQRAIIFSPDKDIPNTRYGLDWENQAYTTRLINKATLGFAVIVTPVPYAYEYGDPLEQSREDAIVPRNGLPENGLTVDSGRIPPWFDINLNFQQDIWEMVIGAIAGLISIRPGIDAAELSRSIGGTLDPFEVEMVANYLIEIGGVRRTQSESGFETEAWWWMCLKP